MYMGGLIPRNFAEVAEAVPIDKEMSKFNKICISISNAKHLPAYIDFFQTGARDYLEHHTYLIYLSVWAQLLV